MKKLLIVITIVCMLLGMSGCNSTETNNTPSQDEIVEGKYPTKWDDTEFYKTQEDMDSDLEYLRTWGDEFLKYKGKLNTVEGLYGFITTDSDLDYTAAYDRLSAYANFGMNAFPAEQKYVDCYNKCGM